MFSLKPPFLSHPRRFECPSWSTPDRTPPVVSNAIYQQNNQRTLVDTATSALPERWHTRTRRTLSCRRGFPAPPRCPSASKELFLKITCQLSGKISNALSAMKVTLSACYCNSIHSHRCSGSCRSRLFRHGHPSRTLQVRFPRGDPERHSNLHGTKLRSFCGEGGKTARTRKYAFLTRLGTTRTLMKIEPTQNTSI